MFGNFSMASYVTPEGFLGLQYFDLMAILILGIFAILIGSGLIASDEENGRLDLILAHPVSRTALIAGRLSAFVARRWASSSFPGSASSCRWNSRRWI